MEGTAENSITQRRSTRMRRATHCYSPEPEVKKSRTKPIIHMKGGEQKRQSLRAYMVKSGEVVSCDICGSSKTGKVNRRKNSNGQPVPYLQLHTRKMFNLCKKCGVSSNFSSEKDKKWLQEKEDSLKAAKKFADSLVQTFGDTEAKKLYCPQFRTRACSCIQRYIIGEAANMQSLEDIHSRVVELLQMMKQANILKKQKCYEAGTKKGSIGLGNGHKHSREYEAFVFKTRDLLKSDSFKLCERAVQQILMYSNNYLHKRIKTDNRVRAPRSQPEKSKQTLLSLSDLYTKFCCSRNCTKMSITHNGLLEEWRERYQENQCGGRMVLVEMLTPSGGTANCGRFISMVTGANTLTVKKIQHHLIKTGGRRSVPEHGLKKYWVEKKEQGLQQSFRNKKKIMAKVPDLEPRGNKRVTVKPLTVSKNRQAFGNSANNVSVLPSSSLTGGKPQNCSHLSVEPAPVQIVPNRVVTSQQMTDLPHLLSVLQKASHPSGMQTTTSSSYPHSKTVTKKQTNHFRVNTLLQDNVNPGISESLSTSSVELVEGNSNSRLKAHPYQSSGLVTHKPETHLISVSDQMPLNASSDYQAAISYLNPQSTCSIFKVTAPHYSLVDMPSKISTGEKTYCITNNL